MKKPLTSFEGAVYFLGLSAIMFILYFAQSENINKTITPKEDTIYVHDTVYVDQNLKLHKVY